MKVSPRRLLVRVGLFALLLFACTAAAQFAVGHLLSRPVNHTGLRHVVSWVVENAMPASASSAEVHKEFVRLHTELGIQVSLYDVDGHLIDSTIDPPFLPLAPSEIARLRTEHWISARPRTPLEVGRFDGKQLVGYALAITHRPDPTPRRVILPMLLTLLVVACGSVPFARSVTKPLERLAATARRLGQGDLQVRAETDRQDEVGDLARAFNEMAERIEQLMRAEKQLLANVSHELRTPLARIRVALELAGDQGRSVNYLPEIAEDLAELERMVDDILTATRLDLAQERVGPTTTPLRLEPTDPRQVLARAVARFTDHHPERELTVEVPDELPALKADPAMLRRVLDNLLENAHRYSNTEQTIRLGARIMSSAGRAETIEISVADEGIGIDAADLPHVFTPFFRSDRSRARQTGGVGMGLPLALRIVRAHGGDIDLQSQVGVGTTVTVRLPISQSINVSEKNNL